MHVDVYFLCVSSLLKQKVSFNMKFSAHGAHNSSLYEKHLHVYFGLKFIVHFSLWSELSLNLVLVREKEHIEVSLWDS